MSRHRHSFSAGLAHGAAIFAGYFPLAVAFGLLAREHHLAAAEAAACSMLVYAGASQFVFIQLLSAGAGGIEIVFTTLLVNLRHLLMSGSLAQQLERGDPPHSRAERPASSPSEGLAPAGGAHRARARRRARRAGGIPRSVLAFGVTDETFAVASSRERTTDRFLFGLELVAYAGWVTGTIAGFQAGSLLPPLLQASLGILLYSLFIAVLVPEALRSYRYAVVAATGALTNGLLALAGLESTGIRLVIAIAAGSLVGAVISREDGE